MLHPDDSSRTLRVDPPLDRREVEILAGLAGVGEGVRRMWPGQPGRRSPWLPCAAGCCLVAEHEPAGDLAAWLRFLVREVVAPRARVPATRARELGLPGGHRVDGRVLVESPVGARLVVASGRQVRVLVLDDDLEPVPKGPSRGPGEVVELGSRKDERDSR